MKQDLFIAIVRAHYSGEQERFKRLVIQAAAHTSNLRVRNELIRLSEVNHPRGDLIALAPAAKEFVMPLPTVDPDALILRDEIRKELGAVAEEHRLRFALELRGLAPRSRILLHGSCPGNGKTSAAAMLCGQIQTQAYWVSLPNVVGSYMGDTAKNFAKLPPVLSQGVTLVVDEIDAVGGRRTGDDRGAGREMNSIVSNLLTLLDQHTGGLFIATTNRLDMLDPALRRRFDAEIEFHPPSDAEKTALGERLCAKYGINKSSVDVSDCVSYDAVSKVVMHKARALILAEERARLDADARAPATATDAPCN